MKQLEDFLYKQITDDDDTKYLCYIEKFKNLSESSQLMNDRKGAFLGYFSLVNVIKRISDERGVEYCHVNLLNELMKNIRNLLRDNDHKIVCSAAQCMYNIMNFFKSYALINFNTFYEGLLQLSTIDDKEVKELFENLDSSLKGIINYSFQGQLPNNFDLLDFFKKIICNISLENPSNKRTIVSWINCINQIPGIKLINILNLFLGDLLDMLQIDIKDVQNITEECLEEFYNEVKKDFNGISNEVKIKIFDIIIQKCNSDKAKNTQLKAFKWAYLFLQQYSYLLIQIANKNKILQAKNNNINTSTSQNNVNSTIQTKVSNNNIINDNGDQDSSYDNDDKKYPFGLFASFFKIILNTLKNNKAEDGSNNELITIANNCNGCLLIIIEKYNVSMANIKLFEEVLMENFSNKEKDLLLLIIKWIEKLFNKFNEEAFSGSFDKFIENFSVIITHKDEEIFEKALNTLCNIAKCRNGSINVIILNIINKLQKDNSVLKNRAKEIVKILCKELNVKQVYSTFADVLLTMNEPEFVGRMINVLDWLLLSSADTEELRNLLKNIQMTTNIEDKKFFEKLFKTWCVNPVSCLILCLIAEYFELSHHMLIKIGELKLNQENYLEHAQLVQLLESNVFLSK